MIEPAGIRGAFITSLLSHWMGLLIRICSHSIGLLSMTAVTLLALIAGCQRDETSTPVRAQDTVPKTKSAKPVQPGPSQVQLTGAAAKLDESGIVRFNIRYEFTSGSPTVFYQCDIKFLETDRYGLKPMTADELSQSGSIITGIEVGDAPVKEFEITLSEAVSPDQGYHLVSNTLRGVVEPAE